MHHAPIPLYANKNTDTDAAFPRTMQFLLKNYKWNTHLSMDPQFIQKIRERDKKVGLVSIQILKRRKLYPDIQTTDHHISINGWRMPFRLFSHKSRPPNRTKRIIIHFHGGGWCFGDLEFYTPTCYKYAHYFNATVLSVDYRKAPEHKFPLPFQDCLAFTQWVSENKGIFGSPNTPIYLMGESAGGNLAAAVAVHLNEHPDPAIRGQILLYPAVDSALHYKSIAKYAKKHLLTKKSMKFYLDAYATTPKDLRDPYFSPIYAPDVSNYLPTMIITGSRDILRDQGFAFHQKLVTAGRRSWYRNYLMGLHGFLNAPEIFYRGEEMYQNFIGFVRNQMFARE